MKINSYSKLLGDGSLPDVGVAVPRKDWANHHKSRYDGGYETGFVPNILSFFLSVL